MAPPCRKKRWSVELRQPLDGLDKDPDGNPLSLSNRRLS
jgi:hypothetical protein